MINLTSLLFLDINIIFFMKMSFLFLMIYIKLFVNNLIDKSFFIRNGHQNSQMI
jgi:hypothetical protein